MKIQNITKKAEAGIGTLILFIAMILVAAVASGVLIQTSGSLQSKALQTGSQAKTQVSSNVLILTLWAENGNDSQLDYMFMKVKLAPGSDPMKINDSYISYSTQSQKQAYRYNNTASVCDATELDLQVGSTFIVNGSVGYSNSGYLLSGDVIDICFKTPTYIGESSQMTVSFVPKVGTPTTIDTTTPDVMTDKRVVLFP